MRLVVHAGTHKTATTAFQRFCYSARSLFADSGFYYPDIKYGGVDIFQHSPLLWQLQSGSRLSVFTALCNLYQNAIDINCHSVFLSGEDFENFLIDSASQIQFEQMLFDAGFDQLQWVIVKRNPLEYFESIYSELSKHGVCINAMSAANAVIRSGWFAVSTANLSHFFAVDLMRLLGSFRARTRGNVRVYEFTDFKASYFLGADLLRDCFGFVVPDKEELSIHIEYANKSKNYCLSEDLVEVNYLNNFLGVDSALLEIDEIEFSKSLVLRKKSFDASLELLKQNFASGED